MVYWLRKECRSSVPHHIRGGAGGGRAAHGFESRLERLLFLFIKAAILIVSYAKDLPFFEACAKSIGKNARGFYAVKVVVPTADVDYFRPAAEPHGIAVCGFDEEPGKGFLSHMRMKCYADHHFPEADVIFHLDADSVIAEPVTPEDWIRDGKVLLPYCEFRHYLTTPLLPDEQATFMGFTGKKVDLNRGQYFWKFTSEFALGWEVRRETMQWMPIAHVREVYPKMRELIKARHKDFDYYVMSCRNSFPQTFCEFNALGAVAFKYFHERYEWHDVNERGLPFARVIQTWSHGGLDREHDFPAGWGGRQTPRQLFQTLGLI